MGWKRLRKLAWFAQGHWAINRGRAGNEDLWFLVFFTGRALSSPPLSSSILRWAIHLTGCHRRKTGEQSSLPPHTLRAGRAGESRWGMHVLRPCAWAREPEFGVGGASQEWCLKKNSISQMITWLDFAKRLSGLERFLLPYCTLGKQQGFL